MVEFITNQIDWLNNLLWSYIIIILLLGLGLFFTIRTKAVQFRLFFEMLKVMTESAGKGRSKKHISPFQAFCISAASRVGTGNLAGVAIAITSGGPGAVFWMWLIALLGGASSFIESTLAQIYKVHDKDNFRGGPAYYIETALKQRGLAIVFVVIISFTFGFAFNAAQANTIAGACEKAFGLQPLHIGLFLTAITGLVIFGGIKRIANISSMVVPVMAGLYILCALYVIISNITLVPKIFMMIFESAFGIKQFLGGTVGGALMFGIKRGLFSNEAGMGSAPNAAATAHTTHPVKQGLIQTLGVFFDTILICSATAFIVLTYVAEGHTEITESGIQLTQTALQAHIPGAHVFVAICIFLFAWSSVIGNYSYGEINLAFISTKKIYLYIFRLMVLAFVLFGSLASMNTVWALADLTMGLMAVINMIAIAALSGTAVKALNDYQRQKKAGKDPIFTKNIIPEISKDLACWD
ncbi:MAG: alanine:cation symporter family protein [Spirochaetaceae bacterium]|jgi:AGCS family alanine or glycine:cation symporter|nr:alanine:cation symporter family protein [Spirochaetaceae bacterium]